MTDYQRYINALKKCAKEHENDRTSTGHIIVSDLCRDTANLLETLEQKPKTNWVEVDVNMYACSKCSHVLTINTLDNSISEMNFCPFCGGWGV